MVCEIEEQVNDDFEDLLQIRSEDLKIVKAVLACHPIERGIQRKLSRSTKAKLMSTSSTSSTKK